MPLTTKIFILILLILAGVTGYNYFYKPFSQSVEQASSPAPSPTPVGTQLQDQLTSRQKVAQLLAVPLTVQSPVQTAPAARIATGSARAATGSANVNTPTSSPSAELVWIWANNPGVVILTGQNVATAAAQTTVKAVEIATGGALRPLVAVEHEGGTRQTLSGAGFTRLPSWSAYCQLENPTERGRLIQDSLIELQETGIDVVFGPVVTPATTSAMLRGRSCGSDAELIAQRSREIASSFKAAHILPVLRYFPTVGPGDLRTNFDRVSLSFADTQVFRDLLQEQGDLGVMVTHVGVRNQHPDVPCSLSRDCVGELSGAFPQAVVFSDDLSFGAASYQAEGAERSLPEVAEAAVRAGNTFLVFGTSVELTELEQVVTELTARYDSDPVFRRQVDTALEKIIAYKVHHTAIDPTP